jgi:D-glucuronyl C5-epimerase C-terminus
MIAGKLWVVAVTAASAALLALAGPAGASPVLEFSHGKTRVVDDPGAPPVTAADVAGAVATAAQAPGGTGGATPPEPPPTTEPQPPPPGGTAPTGPSITPLPPPPAGVVGSGTVPAVLDSALAQGLLSQADHDIYRALYDQAIQARSSLAGQCRKQLRNVIRDLDAMARKGSLTTTRMPALFLQLRRNTEFWSSHPRVAAAQRVKFGSSELLWQHYAGEGLQIQPLGNFGKANGLYTQCQHPTKDKPCERRKLKTLLDELLPLKSVRGDFFTWEYYFPFGGGHPPWMSGMAQATAIEALARSSQLYGDPSYAQLAGQMIGAFNQSPPIGVRVSADGGNHYLIYSFAPRVRVLNAFLQTLIGLFDYIKITGDQVAQFLFDAGNIAALRELPRYDTGNWAYYSLPAKEQSTYGYMSLVTGFLDGLCQRTGDPTYCSFAKRWHRYLSKVPREPVRPLPPAKECGY